MIFPDQVQKVAGEKIGQILQAADQHPELQQKITPLLEKHFGTVQKPNMSLMPNVPASEKGSITKLLRQEIMAQGRSKGGIGATFKDIQGFKQGAAARAGFDRSISSGKQDAFKRIAAAYSRVMTEAVPQLKPAYALYGKAANQVKTHGAGLEGLIHGIMTGGGAGGWMMRQAVLYPLLNKVATGVQQSISPKAPEAEIPRHIGFTG